MAYHFNNRIEITELRESEGPEAGDTEEVVIAKPWTDIKTLKGTEFDLYQLTANEQPIRFIIRYREGINTMMTIKYKNKKYDIKSVSNDNGKNETLTIFATTKIT
ncbi:MULTISPECIES: phage head closure protein [Mammaliicoccus]|uniref:phage head closure protein n=1 Tax=Mammaliicoccus TaxID=2803850 RepID=UPI0002EA6027|nr:MULTISPECIES: phage head closure protein [Mammaliicoccus]